MIPTWSPPWESTEGEAVPSGTPPDQTARVRYTSGQFLGAVDLADEQRYHRDQLRRHDLGPHTWGIVAGFELSEVPDPTDAQFVEVVVGPGLAVDGYGRQIVSFAPARLGAALFDAFTDSAHRSVWLTYSEASSREPGDGFANCRDGEPTRTIEEFRLVADPAANNPTIIVDGSRVVPPPDPPGPLPAGAVLGPADLSVPHQELPTDAPVVPWLIRLGTVLWDGTVSRLRPAAPDRLNELRRYAGVVADHVLAPTPTLRVAPRVAPADVDGAEFTTVEGRLRAQGRLTAERELWLEGEPARFTYDGGAEDDVPITLGRQHGPADQGDVLRLRLGDDPESAETTLSVGAAEGATASTALEVRADGTVSVPTGHLDFGTDHRQQIDLNGPDQGIGTQPGVTYLRTDQEFAWFKGGSHVDAARDPGPTGQLQMLLDADGTLDFGARTRQMIDLWSVAAGHNYGIGVQPFTLYFRTDFDVCWFRGGSHVDVANSPGGGGVLAMRLNSANELDVFGPVSASADVTVGAGGDAVLRTRHVVGKGSGVDTLDSLFLNWNNGHDVVVGNRFGIRSDLEVSGDLRVFGSVDSVVKFETFEVTCQNSGSSPGSWSVNWSGSFDAVDSVVAMITGYSINGDIGSANPGRFQNTETIPQHVWVDVDTQSTIGASGQAFCAQSDAAEDGNNEVRFNLLVMGRRWT